MANYKKMYATLCGEIDDVIDKLEKTTSCQTRSQQIERRSVSNRRDVYSVRAIYRRQRSKGERTQNRSKGAHTGLIPIFAPRSKSAAHEFVLLTAL